MFKLISPPIAGALLALPCLAAAPALAAAPVTFVSGKGTDAGTCASPANPCRSFEFALGQTSPSGEIKALGPADYGSVTITKSVSISGVEGAGIDNSAGNAITINAGPNDTVSLSHLILDGFNTALRGVMLTSGGSLIITDCIIRNFTTRGITLQPQGTTAFDIADTTVSRTGAAIEVQPQQAGKAFGTFTHVSMNDSGTGIVIAGPVTALAIASTAVNNSHGFDVAPRAVLRLAHSTSSGNALGVFVVNGGTIESAGDNFINGNTQDFDGTLTKFDTQ
jgi:hypothetical protein